MFPTPKSVLIPNTCAYESEPMVKATGFREYDARWLFGKEINLMGVQALGMGLGALIAELGVSQEIVTGHDFRGYSASIKYALISGLMATAAAWSTTPARRSSPTRSASCWRATCRRSTPTHSSSST